MANKTAKGTTLQNALSASLNAETSAVQNRFNNRFARVETLQNTEPDGAEHSAADRAPQKEAREARESEKDKAVHAASVSSPSSQEEVTTQESRVPEQSLVIRDSFTMPEADYAVIARTRQRCLNLRCSVTKAEVLRAGLAALDRLDDAQLLDLFETLPKVKTGRPAPARTA